MALPPSVTSFLEWWSAYYGDHHAISITTRFMHLAGIVVGGGTAITADGAALRARRDWARRKDAVVAAMAEAHWVVVPSLGVIVATGLMMTAADTETFLNSRMFWSKMALFAVLVLNGAGLVAAERAAARSTESAPGVLTAVSGVSLVAWLGVLLLGTWLTVAA